MAEPTASEDPSHVVAPLGALIDAALDAVLVAPAGDRSYVVANSAAERLTGYSRAELLRMRPDDLLDPDETGSPPELGQAAAGARAGRAERRLRRKDGDTVPVEVTVTWLEIGGRVLVQQTLRDLTEQRRVLAELERRMARFAEAEQLAHVGSWQSDEASGRIWWSDEMYRLVGRDPASFVPTTENTLDWVHPDDLDRILDAMRVAFETATPFEYEFRVVRPGGEVRHLRARGTAVFDEAGRPTETIGTMQDVTEWKRAEEELARRAAQLADAQRLAHLGSWEWDIVGDRVWWSEELTRILGAPHTDFSMTIEGNLEWAHPDDRARLREEIETTARTGRQYDYEFRIVRPDGTIRHLHARGSVERDDSGRPVRMYGTAQDITERKRAEEAHALLAAIVESSDDAIFSKTLDGIITSWNPGATRIYGYAASEIVGKSVATLVPSDGLDELREILGCVGRGEHVERIETIRVCKDGRRIAVSLTISPIHDTFGRLVGASTIARDVTADREQQRQETQAEKLRALGQMAGGVAHDLNQSLSLILGYGELIRQVLPHDGTPAVREVHEMLRIVTQAAYDGGETVSRLLSFARGHEEAQDGPLAPVDVASLLQEVARLTAPRWRDASQAEGRPVRLVVDAEPGITINGSHASLYEVFTNLVFNAVDALPQGGLIRLSARLRSGRAVVEVADDGEGIPPDVRDKIFEPFFTTKGVRGTGLGLAMVHSIVRRHDGAIAVSSRPGEGTVFSLEFPATAVAPLAEPASAQAGAAERLHRVLVVDDQEAITRMAARILGQHGHTVATATSAEAALATMEAASFDLVMSDVAMGEGLNGWQLAARVRERWPNVRIILATGWGAGIDPDEARSRGVDAVIAKPYRAKDILEVIGSLFEGRARDTPGARDEADAPDTGV